MTQHKCRPKGRRYICLRGRPLHVAVEKPQGCRASLALHVSWCVGFAMLVVRFRGEFAQLGRILPQSLFPGFFILERSKNLGGDGVLFVLGKLAHFSEGVCK